jgi:dynamin 1-like protein
MSVRDAIEREKMYFATHPVYSTMPPGTLGTDILTSKLGKVLFTHIKHNLPEITKEIRDKARDIEERLRDLGPPLPAEGNEKMHLLWNMITDFVTIYKNTITGKFDSKRYSQSNPAVKKELSGGAKIKLHFYGLYKNFLNFNATQEYSDQDIEKAIMLHEGDTIPGFPSVDVFIYLIQPQLEKLREPALDLL